MNRSKISSQGSGLIIVLTALAIIIILAGLIYYGSTRNTKNSIKTKKNAEKEIEIINNQVDDYNQIIKKQLERIDGPESDKIE